MKLILQTQSLIILLTTALSSCHGKNLRQRQLTKDNTIKTSQQDDPTKLKKTHIGIEDSIPSSSNEVRQLRASKPVEIGAFAVSAMGGVMNVNTMSGF